MTSNAFFVAIVLLGAASVPAPESQSDATAKKVNSLLTTMASAPEKTDRSNAAEELLRMGKTAVPALVAAVKHANAAIRYHTVAILGGMGADGAPAVPELIRAAKSPTEDAGVRQRAIYSLGEIRADEKRCVPFLLETLQRGNPDLDELAGEALGKFGGKAKSAVPALVKMVEGRKKKLEVVVRVLGKIGPDAKAAVPALQGLFADPKYKEMQPLVERALEQIQIDRKRALAPTAPPEDNKGPAKILTPNQREEAQMRVALAKSDLEMWQERLVWCERMAKHNFTTAAQVQADREQFRKAKAAFEKAERELKALTPIPERPLRKERKPARE